MAKRFRAMNICWTLNNYTEDDEFQLLFPELPIRYICWGYEVGESGTPHLQGYCEFTHVLSQSAIKAIPGFKKANIQKREGTQSQAIEYTKKDGIWLEIGQKKIHKRGQRNDLDDVREAAKDMGMREVSCWASAQQIKVAEKYLTYNEPKRTEKPTVVWLWGETGCGKTRMANKMFPNAYTKSEGSKWWDGYDRHEDVILDDFRGDWMKFHELLTLIDRYERRIEFKGGSRQFVAKNIVITSCKPPEEVYAVTDEKLNQLLRRIDIVTKLGNGSDTEVGGNTTGPLPQ